LKRLLDVSRKYVIKMSYVPILDFVICVCLYTNRNYFCDYEKGNIYEHIFKLYIFIYKTFFIEVF